MDPRFLSFNDISVTLYENLTHPEYAVSCGLIAKVDLSEAFDQIELLWNKIR